MEQPHEQPDKPLASRIIATLTQLAYLAHNAGRVITRDLLLEHVCGAEYVGESHMLQVNINRLRRKIEPDAAHPRYLLTKIGVGYLLAAHPNGEAAH